MAKPKTLTNRLHKEVGISQPYASQIANGLRKPPLAKALLIYDKIGVALGPLTGKTPREIAAMRRAAELLGAA